MVLKKIIATLGLLGLLTVAGCGQKKTEQITRKDYEGTSQKNNVTLTEYHSYKTISQSGNSRSWPEYRIECRIYSNDSNSPWEEIIGIAKEDEFMYGKWDVTVTARKGISEIPPATRLQAKDALNMAVREVGTINHKVSEKTETRDF